MYLSGGPGGAGFSEMLSVLPSFPDLVENYRLIGYDQRGTGRSGLLRCPRLEKDPQLRDTAAAAECAEQIGIARRHYTTPDSVQDIEAIRAELGVEQLTLFGISYGTELALAYARAYPQHVERLVLDSVVDYDDPDPFFTVGMRAMGPSLKSVCPLRCRYLTPDPGAELGQLVAKLHAQPMRAAHLRRARPLAAPEHHAGRAVRPDVPDRLPALAARGRSRSPSTRRSKATARRWRALLRESKRFDAIGSPRDFSVARYATTCETNPVPWDVGTPLDQRPASVQQRLAALPAGTFAPFDATVVTEDEVDLCLRWPDVPHPASATPAPPYPNIPTLILQGGEDLRTPPEWSARIQQRIPGAIRLVIPGVGHSTVSTSACAVEAITDFVRDRRPPSSCQRLPTGVPAVVAAPASVRVAARLPGPADQGRADGARGRGDDRRPPADALRRARQLGRRAPRRVVGGSRGPADPARLSGRARRDGLGPVNRTFRLSVAGAKAARGTLTLKGSRLKAGSAAARSPCGRERAHHRRRRRAPVGALTYRIPAILPSAAAPATVRNRVGHSGRPTRVLIAEDDDSLRALLRLSIDVGGLEIAETADGTSALDLARASPPDLVLLDWMMPGLSGLDLCRALRADPKTAGATIVMVTARAMARDRDAALAAGADHYVAKPFSPGALLETVRHAL